MMEEYLINWMPENKLIVFFISIILNVLIAISGVLPSAFLTAVNIAVFDFNIGLVVSIIGEALGAVVSFILYRKGLTKLSNTVQLKNRFLSKLHQSKGIEAVLLVLVLRVLPFVPSGVVTLTAAYSKIGLVSFCLASTIGKVPALLIEAYSVDRVLGLSTEWQISVLIVVLTLLIIYFLWKKRGTKS
jgi:uncharacterized membrane protein YdjX (TVP38/TMEM64 family)